MNSLWTVSDQSLLSQISDQSVVISILRPVGCYLRSQTNRYLGPACPTGFIVKLSDEFITSSTVQMSD